MHRYDCIGCNQMEEIDTEAEEDTWALRFAPQLRQYLRHCEEGGETDGASAFHHQLLLLG